MSPRTSRRSHRPRIREAALVALLALAGPIASPAQDGGAPAEPAPFALALAPEGAVVTGLAPGGEALLFSVAREPLGYLSRVSRRDEVLVADETGTAVFVPLTEAGEPAAMPAKAVWIAVDLATGSLATAVGEGFEAPRRALPPDALRRGPSRRFDRLADQLESAQIVYVRPGTLETRGIWGVTVMDGSLFDEDRSDDGRIEAALDRLIPLAGSAAPPEEVAAGDVVALVDTTTLAFFATRLEL